MKPLLQYGDSAHPVLSLPELAKCRGLINAADAMRFGIWRTYLAEIAHARLLTRVARGVYGLPGQKHSHAAIACKCVRRGVLCLLSALHIHNLLRREPSTVWMALGPNDRIPRLDIPVRFVRFSGRALPEGIEHIDRFGAPTLRVYSVEKTLADCFKFRNRIGPDVAAEALKRAVDEGRCNLDRLRQFAAICRVTRRIDASLRSPLPGKPSKRKLRDHRHEYRPL